MATQKKLFIFKLFILSINLLIIQSTIGKQDIPTYVSKAKDYASGYASKVKEFFTPDEKDITTKEFEFNDKSNLEIHLQKGNISIKTWNSNKLLIEIVKKGSSQELNSTNIRFVEKDNRLQIISSHKTELVAYINLEILLPAGATLKSLNTDKGFIKIKNVSGSINATSHEGDIEIENSSSTVNAKTDNGKITVRQKSFDNNSSIFLESLYGNINLYLPKETDAQLSAKTNSGRVTSELYITTKSKTLKLNRDSWKQFTKEAIGQLGAGGAPITLETDKGNINIYEY